MNSSSRFRFIFKHQSKVDAEFDSNAIISSTDLGSDCNSHIETVFGPNRRSSLGAESLLEHDITEENGILDSDGTDCPLTEAQLGLEYTDDIFRIFKQKEHVFHPVNCMKPQPQVTEFMRCTLVNWLTKMNHQLKFSPETVFIAVNMADRFLTKIPIAQDCFQLLAVCSLFVAAKLEDGKTPGITVMATLCGRTYEPHHFRRMEELLLTTLKFNLNCPSSWFFVNHLTLKMCQMAEMDRKVLSLSRYVIETALSNYQISQFLPSHQAAASISFSCLFLHLPSVQRDIVQSELPYEDKANLAAGALSDCLTPISGALSWVVQSTFTIEEVKLINLCIALMCEFMEAFLQSQNLENLSSASMFTDDAPCAMSVDDFSANMEVPYEDTKTPDECSRRESACFTPRLFADAPKSVPIKVKHSFWAEKGKRPRHKSECFLSSNTDITYSSGT